MMFSKSSFLSGGFSQPLQAERKHGDLPQSDRRQPMTFVAGAGRRREGQHRRGHSQLPESNAEVQSNSLRVDSLKAEESLPSTHLVKRRREQSSEASSNFVGNSRFASTVTTEPPRESWSRSARTPLDTVSSFEDDDEVSDPSGPLAPGNPGHNVNMKHSRAGKSARYGHSTPIRIRDERSTASNSPRHISSNQLSLHRVSPDGGQRISVAGSGVSHLPRVSNVCNSTKPAAVQTRVLPDESHHPGDTAHKIPRVKRSQGGFGSVLPFARVKGHRRSVSKRVLEIPTVADVDADEIGDRFMGQLRWRMCEMGAEDRHQGLHEDRYQGTHELHNHPVHKVSHTASSILGKLRSFTDLSFPGNLEASSQQRALQAHADSAPLSLDSAQLTRGMPWVHQKAGLGNSGLGTAPFRLSLSCSQSSLLLNVLAVGYAGTAVVVKAMEGDESSAIMEATLQGTGAAMSLAGSCLSVITSAEFALRFGSAAAVASLFLWVTRMRASVKQANASGETAHQQKTQSAPARKKGDEQHSQQGLVAAGLDLGFWMFVTYAGQAVGLQTTSAHDAALILTASVVLVPFLEALEGRRLHFSVWMATALACTGLILLEGGGGAAEAATQAGDVLAASSSFIPSGHFWCFLGAVGSAVHVVRSEAQCTKHSPLELVTLQLATAAVLGALWLAVSVVYAGGFGGLGVPGAAPSSGLESHSLQNAFAAVPLGMVLLSGPLGTGVCEWLELEALQYVKASTATLILTASPLWASLLAYFTLGETMTTATLVGGSMIMASSLQVQLLSPCKETGN